MKAVSVPMESLAEVIRLQLENGGKATLTVTGGSMLPMLRNRRDMVVLIPPKEPKKGDIALFVRKNGSYVLHRIVAVTETGFLCCGDNQDVCEPITPEQIVAVVDGFSRKGKFYTLDGFGYRAYKAVWMKLFFLRPCYIRIRRYFGKLRRKLTHKTAGGQENETE